MVRVEQGPEWLAELIYAPPPWVAPVLTALVVALALLVAVAWWRASPRQRVGAVNNGLVAVSIGVATYLFREAGLFGYGVDVVAGVVVGGGSALVAVRLADGWGLDREEAEA